MKRKVEIYKVSSGGVQLQVTFEDLGWLYGFEVSKDVYFASMTGGDNPSFTSKYFKYMQEADAWIEALTEEMLKIKENQEKIAQAFKTLEGEAELPLV